VLCTGGISSRKGCGFLLIIAKSARSVIKHSDLGLGGYNTSVAKVFG
jgi:hypothetical protein